MAGPELPRPKLAGGEPHASIAKHGDGSGADIPADPRCRGFELNDQRRDSGGVAA